MSAHNDRYGWPHRHLRARVRRDVEAGAAVCSRCGLPIRPWEPWDLDHVDEGGPRDYRGPSHRKCNRQVLTHQATRRAEASEERVPAASFPDPDPGNLTDRWSRHWFGPANPRCPHCRAAGGPCADADAA